MNIERRETSAWAIAAVLGLLGIAGVWSTYHEQFEQAGTSDAGIGAVFLFLKSQSESTKNTYTARVEECKGVTSAECNPVRIEDARERLKDLEFEQRYIDGVTSSLGIEDDN